MKELILILSLLTFTSSPAVYASSDVNAFVTHLPARVQTVMAMPEGESRAANVILILSDIFAVTSNLGVGLQNINANFNSPSATIADAQRTYEYYRSWTHPAVMLRVTVLRDTLRRFQPEVREFSTAASALQSKAQSLSSGVLEVASTIQSRYSTRPIGPIASNVMGWGHALTNSFASLSVLYVAYGTRLQVYIDALETDRDPGPLAAELAQLERQIQSFQPVAGYSYTQMAQFFEAYSQSIRAQYPGMR
ncbi:MAG: hypothetical protein AB7G93_12800 [Bdellovibrionales bacterium]